MATVRPPADSDQAAVLADELLRSCFETRGKQMEKYMFFPLAMSRSFRTPDVLVAKLPSDVCGYHATSKENIMT